MRYNGGKHAVKKELAAIFNSHTPRNYWEPFCGAGSVINEIKADYKLGTDADPAIIHLIKAVQLGWQPPETLSEEEYKKAKLLPETNPLHAFAKYGCSFGGSPSGGYAREGTRNFALNARNSLLKDKIKYQETEFKVSFYDAIDFRKFDLIYCDPPYKGKREVGVGAKFDHNAFWDWVRNASKYSIVYVTELQAPEDFECVWEKYLRNGLGSPRVKERLFKLNTSEIYK